MWHRAAVSLAAAKQRCGCRAARSTKNFQFIALQVVLWHERDASDTAAVPLHQMPNRRKKVTQNVTLHNENPPPNFASIFGKKSTFIMRVNTVCDSCHSCMSWTHAMYVLPGHSCRHAIHACHIYIYSWRNEHDHIPSGYRYVVIDRYTKPPLTQSSKNRKTFRQVEFPYKQMLKIEAFWLCIDHMEPFENTAIQLTYVS